MKSSLVPKALCNSCQKTEVKVAPLSDTILSGTPCRQTIRLMYNLANLLVEYVCLVGKSELTWLAYQLSPK